MGKIGKILGFLAVLTVTSGNAWAGDITTGYTFSSGEQNVTHTKLNNQVNNAVINPTFFTGKAAVTTTASGDLILIYHAASGTIRKISIPNIFESNAGVITNQVEDLYPAPGDYILTFDISDGTLKKATVTSAFLENTNLISGRPDSLTPDGDAFFLAYDAGVWSRVSRSNLFYNLWAQLPASITNLTTLTTPTNNDALVVFDSDTGEHKQLPLINLFSNAAPVSSLGATDVVTAVVGGRLATVPYSVFSTQAPQLHFVTPTTVYSGTAGATSYYSVTNAGVPTNALAVVVEAYGLTWAGGDQRAIKAAANLGDTELTLLYLYGNSDNVRPDGDSNQGVVPVSATNTFRYTIVATTSTTTLNVIGYYK